MLGQSTYISRSRCSNSGAISHLRGPWEDVTGTSWRSEGANVGYKTVLITGSQSLGPRATSGEEESLKSVAVFRTIMSPRHHPWSKKATIIPSLHNPAAPVEPPPSGKGFGSTKSVRISVHLRLTASIALLPSAPAQQGAPRHTSHWETPNSVWSTCHPLSTREVYTHSPNTAGPTAPPELWRWWLQLDAL